MSETRLSQSVIDCKQPKILNRSQHHISLSAEDPTEREEHLKRAHVSRHLLVLKDKARLKREAHNDDSGAKVTQSLEHLDVTHTLVCIIHRAAGCGVPPVIGKPPRRAYELIVPAKANRFLAFCLERRYCAPMLHIAKISGLGVSRRSREGR